MKIRTDFVTNSSSSSYCTVNITSLPLAKMLDDYDRAAAENGNVQIIKDFGLTVDTVSGEIRGKWDDYSYLPFDNQRVDSLDRALCCLCEGIKWAEENSSQTTLPVRPLIQAITECKESLVDSIQYVDWDSRLLGWGSVGGDSKFDKSNYSEEELEDIYYYIVEEKEFDGIQYTIEDVTDDDFYDYVEGLDLKSEERTTYHFDRATGEESHYTSFGLV